MNYRIAVRHTLTSMVWEEVADAKPLKDSDLPFSCFYHERNGLVFLSHIETGLLLAKGKTLAECVAEVTKQKDYIVKKIPTMRVSPYIDLSQETEMAGFTIDEYVQIKNGTGYGFITAFRKDGKAVVRAFSNDSFLPVIMDKAFSLSSLIKDEILNVG